jgi:putative N-acetyltransferase (TIGR04045 family)
MLTTGLLSCRVAVGAAERDEHLRIRRAVFVEEQGLFDLTDVGPQDADPRTVHVLGLVDGVPGGTVRLYPLEQPDSRQGDSWQGDRLAVLPGLRQAGLGAPLVRFAVRTAAERGGTRMLAMVQVPNVRFFVRLGWAPLGDPVGYVGRPHQRMQISLRPDG